jgi:hypothetical protein
VLRPSVLGLALVLSTPALWAAFASGSMGLTTALIRFLIAVPVAALMLALMRMVTESYARSAARRDLAARIAAARETNDQQVPERR